jgi:hypothetical protein
LRGYRWSSYREYIGLADPSGFLETGPILGLAGGTGAVAAVEYGRYVEAGLADTDAEFEALLRSSAIAVGDECFCGRIDDLYEARQRDVGSLEDVAFRRVQPSRTVAEVLDVVAGVFQTSLEELRRRRYGCRLRAVAARMLGEHAGISQRDIGVLLGMGTGSAVCQQLRALEACTDSRLKAGMARADELLSGTR